MADTAYARASAAAAQTAPSAQVSVGWILGAGALPAHVDPARDALRWQDGALTYADLRRRTLRLARGLRDLGLAPGDRVAVHLLNRGETFELYFACAFAGLTLVPINFRMTAYEVALVLEDCSPRLLISQRDIAQTARDGAARAGVPEVVVLEDDGGGPEYEALFAAAPLAPPFDHTNPHLILYTSGTTGRPKGVMLTHCAITWFAFQQAALYRDLGPEATTLIIGPTYNTAGINEQSIPTLLAGGTVALHPSRGWTPQRTADLVDAWQVTHTLIYPSMMEPFLEADAGQPLELRSLRFVLTGGENCPPATLGRFRRRWPHISLCNAYGLTEGGVISTLSDEEIERRPGSVGRAFGGQTFRIVGDGGRDVTAGELGAVWTAGPAVTAGYWNAPELTDAALHDGWLDTGDRGRVDDEGYLYIEGRSRDLIISKGQNIYPAEIENAILTGTDVLDCAVIGVPDEEYGEAVCAVVVPKPGYAPTAGAIVDRVRERLASYKKPRHVVFAHELPRSPSGKVLKAELARDIHDRLERR
jgi:acyl-CoA synthetase (AMP-forming)/AMP-acid ligase II